MAAPSNAIASGTIPGVRIVELPYAVHIGARESFETGRPYGRLITVRGLTQGATTILAEPRGAYEMPSTNDLQMRIDKDFKTVGRQRLRCRSICTTSSTWTRR